MLRVVVVGAGPMGRLHARAVARRAARAADCRLVGIVDRHPARSERVATEFESTSLSRVPDAADAAIVAVPTGEHARVVGRLLARGLDVLVEKPMTGTARGASALAERARQAQRVLSVGHAEWWNPVWSEVLCAAGAPRNVLVERLHPASDRGLDIDVVQDSMLHDLDWLRRTIDAPLSRLEATGSCLRHDRLDEAEARLEFGNGVSATLRASRVHAERRRRVEVEGDSRRVRGDLLTGEVVDLEGGASLRPAGSRGSDEDPDSPARFEPLDLQLADFLEACATRGKPVNDASEGVATLEWVDRVRASIAAGT